MKALCVKTGASNLRFWGKIRGTKADYYIAEVTADAGGDGEGDAQDEGAGNAEGPG